MKNWQMRIVHIPTGATVMTDGRCFASQHKAKLALLRWIRAKVAHPCDASGEVRTYNFADGVVTDHRTGEVSPLPVLPPSFSGVHDDRAIMEQYNAYDAAREAMSALVGKGKP
jgi:hypothetical protein